MSTWYLRYLRYLSIEIWTMHVRIKPLIPFGLKLIIIVQTWILWFKSDQEETCPWSPAPFSDVPQRFGAWCPPFPVFKKLRPTFVGLSFLSWLRRTGICSIGTTRRAKLCYQQGNHKPAIEMAQNDILFSEHFLIPHISTKTSGKENRLGNHHKK